MASRLVWTGAPIVTLFTVACGGGGSGGQAAGDAGPSTLQVGFPPPVFQTETDTITVRGTASDLDGVAAVQVGGVGATSSDGFATWEALIPLQSGRSELVVEVRDNGGRTTRGLARLTVENEPTMSDPGAIALDAARGRLLLTDLRIPRLTALDLADGSHRPFSDATHGTGPVFSLLAGIEVDPNGDRLYAIDRSGLFAVELSSGNRTIVSGSGIGNGPDFIVPEGLALDLARGRALVTDGAAGAASSPALMSVDLATGERTIVSDDATGAGPLSQSIQGVAIVPPGSLALVVSRFPEMLLAVDLATGDRTIVSDAARGSGPAFVGPLGVEMKADGSAALVTDQVLRALIAVDLVTGDRAVVSDAITGDGPPLGASFDVIELDATAGVAALPDFDTQSVQAVDLSTGDRTDLAVDLTGTGDAFLAPFDFTFEKGRERVLVAQGFSGTGAVLAVDLLRGDRTVLSGAGHGSGPLWETPSAISLDEETQRAIVVDGFDSQLLTLDLATGDRAILSDDSHGSGPEFTGIRDMVVDPVRRFAIVADIVFAGAGTVGRILAVDLESGDRLAVSDDQRGSGPFYEDTFAIAVDSSRNRVLALDDDQELLFAVDLVTGDRTIVSGGAIGGGPAFDHPIRMAIDLGGSHAIVANDASNDGALLLVDLDTGDRTLLMEATRGFGPRFASFLDLEPGRSADELFVFDQFMGALLIVDRVTGDRVILSQ